MPNPSVMGGLVSFVVRGGSAVVGRFVSVVLGSCVSTVSGVWKTAGKTTGKVTLASHVGVCLSTPVGFSPEVGYTYAHVVCASVCHQVSHHPLCDQSQIPLAFTHLK
jgi:hypothetical protein